MRLNAILFGLTDWSTITPTEHWCCKGHVLLCLEGSLDTELDDGRRFTLTPGISYQVADNAEAHRSSTQTGAKRFIVD